MNKEELGYKAMPKELQEKVAKLTKLQSAFCYYRAQGFSQTLAAKKAGSKAKKDDDLKKIGYLMECRQGVKDYIAFLKTQEAISNLISEDKVVSMLIKNYEQALESGNLHAANKAAELLGNTLGMFITKPVKEETKSKTKNNVEAFKEDIDTKEDKESKIRRIKSLLANES